MTLDEFLEYIDGSEEGVQETLVRFNIEQATDAMWLTSTILDVFRQSNELSEARILLDDRKHNHQSARAAFLAFRERLSSSLRGDTFLNANTETGCLSAFCPQTNADGEFIARRVETFPSVLNMFPSSSSERLQFELAELTDDQWNALCVEANELHTQPEDLRQLRRSLDTYIRTFSTRLPQANNAISASAVSTKQLEIEAEVHEVRDPLPNHQDGDKTLWFAPCDDQHLAFDPCRTFSSEVKKDLIRCKARSGLINERDVLPSSNAGAPKYHLAAVFFYIISANKSFRPSVWADGYLETFSVLPEINPQNFGRSVNVGSENYGEEGDLEVVTKIKHIKFSRQNLILSSVGFVPLEDRNMMLPLQEHTQAIIEKRSS